MNVLISDVLGTQLIGYLIPAESPTPESPILIGYNEANKCWGFRRWGFNLVIHIIKIKIKGGDYIKESPSCMLQYPSRIQNPGSLIPGFLGILQILGLSVREFDK